MAGNPIVKPTLSDEEKRRLARAEDIVYTINHAISCGITDVAIQPLISPAIERWIDDGILPRPLHWVRNLFEKNHGHGTPSHNHSANCDQHANDHPIGKPQSSETVGHSHDGGHAMHWLKGEAWGDVGGIVPAILVHRLFPSFSQGIRTVLEPWVGKRFRHGAERSGAHWALQHGYKADSPEARQKGNQLYEYEMSHLPLVVEWNMFSVPINLGVVWCEEIKHGHKPKLSTLLLTKTFGTLFSNGVLLSGRAIWPKNFHAWDDFWSRHAIEPITSGINHLLGNEVPQQTIATPATAKKLAVGAKSATANDHIGEANEHAAWADTISSPSTVSSPSRV